MIQPHTPTDQAASLRCPLLGLYGGRDDSINPADVNNAAQLAREAGHVAQIHIFPEAGHGFHADYRKSYNKAAAEQGWAEAIAWLKAHGVA